MTQVDQSFFPLHLVPDPHPRVQQLTENLPLDKTAVIETFNGVPIEGYDMLVDLCDDVEDAVKYAEMMTAVAVAEGNRLTTYRVVTPRRWRKA